MYYIIYQTTNNVNGKRYIGKHVTKNLNDEYLGSGVALKRAIKKYGKENFKREILFFLNNEDELNNKEIEIITKEIIDNQSYYNMKYGGNGGGGFKLSETAKEKLRQIRKGSKASEETKNKMSNSRKGNTNALGCKHSEEANKKKSESRKGENNIMYGRKHSPETIEKMREIKRGKSHTEEQKKKISDALKGDKNPFYGKKHSPETIEKIRESAKNRRRNG